MTAPTIKELKSFVYLRKKLYSDDVTDDDKARIRFRLARLVAWIEEIDDPMIHDIFTFRFIKGFTWVKTAQRIGGGNSEDGVRMLATRYLTKQ